MCMGRDVYNNGVCSFPTEIFQTNIRWLEACVGDLSVCVSTGAFEILSPRANFQESQYENAMIIILIIVDTFGNTNQV